MNKYHLHSPLPFHSSLTRSMKKSTIIVRDRPRSASKANRRLLPTVDFISSDADDEGDTPQMIDDDLPGNSFHESDRTDSGLGGESGSNWRLIRSYHPLLRAATESTSPDATMEDSVRSIRLEKTGWLHVKHWLTVQQSEKIELASKRQWKQFWAHLKGTALQLFLNYTDPRPKFTINLTDILCYPFPEHPHRQHVFNLTLSTGDTYCVQTSDQAELDHWIRSIHYQCLLQRSEDSLQLKVGQLEEKIRRENRIVKLAQLQLKLINNDKTRSLICQQIELWENNLEAFHMEIFRYKCYLSASSTDRSLPNPQDLLSHATTRTKLALFKLMALTPCGFYTSIAARHRWNGQPTTSTDTVSVIVKDDAGLEQTTTVSIRRTATVNDLLRCVADRLGIAVEEYFLYFLSICGNRFLADPRDRLQTLTYSSVSIARKVIYQIVLNESVNSSGIEIVYENPSKVLVSQIGSTGEAARLEMRKGDEIIMINHLKVQDLDHLTFNDHFNQIPLVLVLRSARLISERLNLLSARDVIIRQNSKRAQSLSLVRKSTMDSSPPVVSATNLTLPLTKNSFSSEQRMEKVTSEFMESERAYVRDLECLLKQYIGPLRSQSSLGLPSDVIESLYRSVQSIHRFQFDFLQRLQVDQSCEDFLQSLAEAFIRVAKNFKLYSTYCALHLRVNRLFDLQQNNETIKEFLSTCNPSGQHASSFESYLIKPVQRLVKYPLFLQQMLNYSKKDETNQLVVLRKAIKTMVKISKYVNSMQQLYEEFGQSFESVAQQYLEEHKTILPLNLSDLHAYGELDWMNIHLFLCEKHRRRVGKTFCFVFANGCLLVARESQEEPAPPRTKKIVPDRFIRFLPLEELKAELLEVDGDRTRHWQLTHTNTNTRLKSSFRFSNNDAHIYVNTIMHCLSTIDKREAERLRMSKSLKRTSDRTDLSFTRSLHSLLSSHTDKNLALHRRRSPSPIWKPRTRTFRKRTSSTMNVIT